MAGSGGEVWAGLEGWVFAFRELSTDRAIGMSVGPIPASAIARWAASEGMDEAEAASFRGCIRAMDRAYLDAVSSPKDSVSATPISPAMVSAMFDRSA